MYTTFRRYVCSLCDACNVYMSTCLNVSVYMSNMYINAAPPHLAPSRADRSSGWMAVLMVTSIDTSAASLMASRADTLHDSRSAPMPVCSDR